MKTTTQQHRSGGQVILARRTIRVGQDEKVMIGPFAHGEVPHIAVQTTHVDPKGSLTTEAIRVDQRRQYHLAYFFHNYGVKPVQLTICRNT